MSKCLTVIEEESNESLLSLWAQANGLKHELIKECHRLVEYSKDSRHDDDAKMDYYHDCIEDSINMIVAVKNKIKAMYPMESSV